MPYRPAGQPLGRALLPYEKELIRTLGISEEDYREYSYEVMRKGTARPAGYEHIPDIRCDPVSIIVSLVIGVATSVAGILLAPKPSGPADEKRGRGHTKKLASRTGTDRFGATAGFDSLSELANYADPIPLVFARREDNIGGILAGGQLVWSRAYSYGFEQGIKMMFVIGEGGLGNGIAKPDLEGIYLGTTALSTVYNNRFAFYWNRNTNVNGRIQAKNHAYGTRGNAMAGDPENNNDIFLAPSNITYYDTAFSQAYSPGSNTQFGCYAPIPNGCGYRVNFRLVPIPKLENQKDDPNATNRRERVKISGKWGESGLGDVRSLGQKGVGREYNRFMGITRFNGQALASGTANNHKARVPVKKGDTCTFVILGRVLEKDRYWGDDADRKHDVNTDDINNSTIKFREQADDALQLGQIVMIARTVWIVEHRSVAVWGQGVVGSFKERGSQEITLRCIETFGVGDAGDQIGVISDYCNNRRIRTDDQGFALYEYSDPNMEGMTVGPGFYPIMKVAFASVRNTRPCDVTEFGIKSQVFNRANSLCNFGPLPTPKALRASDKRGDSIQSGTMSTYFPRTSVFTIAVRPAGTDSAGNDFAWALIGEQFAVRGSAPVDQYNFIRIQHPELREYEYRFIPKNGGDIAQHSPDNAIFWLLDARLNRLDMAGVNLAQSYTTRYGTFVISSTGRYVSKGEIEFAPELSTGTETNDVREVINVPSSIQAREYYPDLEPAEAKATAVGFNGMLPDGYSKGREAACWWELWGQASYYGKTGVAVRRFNFPNRWIELEFSGVVSGTFPVSHPYYPGWRAWGLTGIRVTGSSQGMNNNDQFDCVIPISSSNPRNKDGLPYTGVRVVVSDTNKLSVPGGRESAYEFELLGNPEGFDVGAVRTADFELDSGVGKIECRMRGTIVIAPPEWQKFWGLTKAWEAESWSVVPGTATGRWTVGTRVLHTVQVSSANPFFSTGARVGIEYGIAGVQQQVAGVAMSADRVFEENGQITDMSNYEERTTSCESNPEHEVVYVNESVRNTSAPQYSKLSSCGLALRAGTGFTSVEQLRVWLASGMEVLRFHPSERGSTGPSNMLPDLIYHLMTDTVSGLGKFFSNELIDAESFSRTATFLKANRLYFNGAITDVENVRSYITQVAPFFLCDFVIGNGRFALEPAVPVTSAGSISAGAVPITALFTDGNIIDGTFTVEHLEADQRRDFNAMMRWRDERVNKLPEEQTLRVRWNEAGSETYPMESFDMTEFCCSEDHAELVARFFLSIRRRITHTISFKTTPEGLALAPGDYIKVITQSSPYHAANNGVVEADGTLVMSTHLDDGAYPVWYYDKTVDAVVDGTMSVSGGKAVEANLHGTLVTIRYAGTSSTVYQVQELTLEEDGLVSVVAMEHPTTGDGISLIAMDLLSPGAFTVDY